MLTRRLPVAVLIVTLGSCATPAPQAPPPPAPVARPVVPPPPAPVPASSDWRDWALTPGNWSYAPTSTGSAALFGMGRAASRLTLTCERGSGRIRLAVLAQPGSVTVRTSSTVRTLPLTPRGDGYGEAVLPASDPLLDAMGFSRGRFVIQQEGAPPLVVPAWAEILRVAEDCR